MWYTVYAKMLLRPAVLSAITTRDRPQQTQQDGLLSPDLFKTRPAETSQEEPDADGDMPGEARGSDRQQVVFCAVRDWLLPQA